MCYTIEKNLTRDELEKRFGKNFKPNRPFSPGKRVSGFSFPDVPVIKLQEPEAIDVLHWGLIPFWSKNEESAMQIRQKTLNAKAETLHEKPSFRHSVMNKRCMVLTNGFYEWQHVGKQKIPYYIRLRDDIATPMAGLYDSWTNKDTGEVMDTFTIITTKANSLMEEIHNTKKRMPVILIPDAADMWIDANTKASDLKHILNGCSSDVLEAVKQENDKKEGTENQSSDT